MGVLLVCRNSQISNSKKLTETRFNIFILSLLKYSLMLSYNQLQHAKKSCDTASGFLNIMLKVRGRLSEGIFIKLRFKDFEWAHGFSK
jgi:hypothetical protein